MRFITFLGAIGAVTAFPTAENLAKLAQRDGSQPTILDERAIQELSDGLARLKERQLPFNPLTKPVGVSGTHAFKPPKKGDQRGPCPGLNALANHGYIPHNGVVGFLDLMEAANSVFGMGIDMTALLAIVGTVFVGNPVSLNPGLSIGGPSKQSNNILGNVFGLLGTPQGLDGSHNTIESDSSATRNDLYETGNAHTMNMTLFQGLLELANDDGIITMEALGDWAEKRFHDSIATNPHFYYGPFTGLIGRNAGYIFAGRFLSNHTVEHPRGGHLSTKVLSSFFGVYEENGKQVYREGHEQIPANWYRIALDYGFVDYSLDLVPFAVQHPILLSFGGNLGEVDSFAGVNLEDITGGVLNLSNLLEDNNLLCFALNVVKTFTPNSLSSALKLLQVPLQLINDALLDPLLDLSCPAWKDLTMGGTDFLTGLRNTYPGARDGGVGF